MKAISPLLAYPLEGPVYLRSSSHELPDVVAALKGPAYQPIELDLDGRVDSVHGGVRTIFATVPDAPVTKASSPCRAPKRAPSESTNLCKGAYRATLKLNGQNGKTHDTRPEAGRSARRRSTVRVLNHRKR